MASSMAAKPPKKPSDQDRSEQLALLLTSDSDHNAIVGFLRGGEGDVPGCFAAVSFYGVAHKFNQHLANNSALRKFSARHFTPRRCFGLRVRPACIT